MRSSMVGVLWCVSFLAAPALAGSGFELKHQSTFTAPLSEGGLLVDSTLGDVSIKADPAATQITAVATRHARADTEAEARELLELMKPTLTPGGSGPVVANSGFRDDKRATHRRNVSISVDWVITVPPSAKVAVESAMGDVEVIGTIAGVEVDAAMGDIDVQGGGRLDLHTSMGDLEVKLLGSPAHVELNSSMGDVGVTVPTKGWGNINARSAQGEVSAVNWSGDAKRWQSSNSELYVEFHEVGPTLEATSSMGDITIAFVR